ncbi:4-hydroxyphenylacetate 3-monooxygenase, oxygenase component [Bacillus sp. FJAT-50079]|uniref:4-hydroxyphenylacetate 3-monooxygenase, oxygenase component n=1 Tax=Bacillus sp. FJAT-50079 TaxID=2833577 RepID=UPI001BC9CA10|nr:4-hydroxyphenylacetate 3-monooxygenase, oxygenase component [Bacillus sp. FJAT-50079]MBS4209480.1 4-hydroxyphenylacetate 3-monooxygenase, oxygenase component [Bacillus sp. FJAT-50079]
MGAISGKEYIDRRNQLNIDLWYDGEKVKGKITEHPSFRGMIQSTASLYDLQMDLSLKDKMTFNATGKNESIGLSYLQPKSKADLKRRRAMIECWAGHSCGMLGRSPDYMNTTIMSYAASAAILKGKDHCFPENIQSLYERAMEKDLSFTHTFITPQVNRSQINLGFSNEPISARVIEKNNKGIIIKGARLLATQGGLTDEVLVYTAPRFFFNPDEAFAFSIPSDTDGLKFICRESFVGGESTFNYPLSSRFEEMDSIVVFDHVLVPWEKVFFYDNVEVATDFKEQSSFYHFAYHQVIIRQIAKIEFIFGLAQLLVETININEYQHIQEKLSEIIIGIETMKALLEKAENEAELDEWGFMRPSLIPLQVASNVFPRIYPRFSEIIQLIAASGIISLPSENAFHSLKQDLDMYLQGDNRNAFDRVKLFRLAWDLTMSSFGTRQTQYERYFFGDPIRLSSQLYRSYPKEKNVKTVSDFLKI